MDERLRVLCQSPIFEDIAVPEIERLLGLARVELFEPRRLVFADGDPGDCLYLVAAGRVEITKTSPDGGEQLLGEIGPRMVFGEASLLTGCPRSATARASSEPLVLCRIDSGPFEELVRGGSAAGSKLLFNLARSLARRLGEVSAVLARQLGPEKSTRGAGDLSVFRDQLFTQWSF